MADAVAMLTINFVGGIDSSCKAACDVNADGTTTGVDDAITLLTANFIGGVEISMPFPDCGPSQIASDAALGCTESGCE